MPTMPRTKLNGLEIVIDETYVPIVKDELKKEDIEDVVPVETVGNAKIFLLNEEGKTFDVLKVVSVKQEDRQNTNNNELDTVCEVCGENVPTKESSLKCHQEKCRDEIDQLQRCSYCDFVSTCSQAVKRHYKSVHGSQIYSCMTCDYSHSVRNRVTFHEAEKHGDKCIECQVCNFTCASNRGLNRHMYRKHRPAETIKKFRRDQCEHESTQSHSSSP